MVTSYNLHKEKKLAIREASTAVIDKIAEFWNRARILMGHKNKMIEKFFSFYHEYQPLKNVLVKDLYHKLINKIFSKKILKSV